MGFYPTGFIGILSHTDSQHFYFGLAEGMSIEFIDVCAKLLGRGGKFAAFLFGFVAIFGAVVVYWVLMTNFMYKIGKFAHGR